ncbi:hypothetical protein SISNIDRAFT_450178 [Sistotremastrum niveocremeum HHB9708]|uniref:F-box domain-containing protein n=1 Tax=Sistotremastrum niveocremeum HHB9708 TaxID=1314777 RepID=A0A164YZC1_9AGAM|nr:hypothetical protein SISNIDRAFT_450178 [Sistotremastrum niveocremeum HHB9708]
MPLLKHVLHLRFPHLRHFRLGIEPENDDQPLAEFLIAHPNLFEVRLWRFPSEGNHDWKSHRASGPLPLLETFAGSLSHMQMLSSSLYLRKVKLWIIDIAMCINFASELSSLSIPFSGVIHLSISAYFVPWNADTLFAIGRCFPALQTLEGMEIAPDFMEFMNSKVEDMAQCLPALRRLVMREFVALNGSSRSNNNGDFPTPDDASMEQAFFALPRLFPGLVSAKHRKTHVPLRLIKEMEVFFSDKNAPVIERKERPRFR